MTHSDTLDQIPRGGHVRVVGIAGVVGSEGLDPIARRLDDLGIRQGVKIEVIRRAPLGDPTVFELHGYHRSESARVEVELDETVAADRT